MYFCLYFPLKHLSVFAYFCWRTTAFHVVISRVVFALIYFLLLLLSLLLETLCWKLELSTTCIGWQINVLFLKSNFVSSLHFYSIEKRFCLHWGSRLTWLPWWLHLAFLAKPLGFYLAVTSKMSSNFTFILFALIATIPLPLFYQFFTQRTFSST